MEVSFPRKGRAPALSLICCIGIEGFGTNLSVKLSPSFQSNLQIGLILPAGSPGLGLKAM